MSYFLFPAQAMSHGLRPRNTYATILTDVVRASADSIDALVLYRELLLGEGTDHYRVGFTAFDAHVGDTSCQLRAGMVLDLLKHHKRHTESSDTLWIDRTVEKLHDLQKNARDMLAKLTIERIHPAKLGIGARQDTPEAILRTLEWDETDLPCHPKALYPRSPMRVEDERQIVCKRSSFGHSGPCMVLDIAAARFQHDANHLPGPLLHHCDTMEHPQHVVVRNQTTTVPRADLRRHSVTSPLLDESGTGAAWNPFDVKIITRFLTYCYVLSKYKSFRRFKHVVGARLYPEAAIRYGDELVEDVMDKKTPDYKHSKATRRIDVEFAALQAWVSELSCAWLQSVAAHSNVGLRAQRMITETVRTSEKNLSSVPAYVGYLLLRELWGRDNDSIILVDRFHSNFFIATLRLETGKNETRPANCVPLNHFVSWHLEHVTAECLLNHSDQKTPHIVIMGNSIDGSYEDYMAASSPDTVTGTRHNSATCEDNGKHIHQFLDHDHDRLALCFFARHRHYTFDLPDPNEAERGEGDVVAAVMKKHFPKLDNHWSTSNDEAEDMGTGRSLKMFSWQHALLETKGRIAMMVLQNSTTMPISAKVI